MTSKSPDLMKEKARLKWRCRVGAREIEMLLFSYVERRYESLSVDDKQTFNDLITHNCAELNSWIVFGHPPSNDRFVTMIEEIRRFS